MSATDGGDPVTRLLQLLTPTELLGMVTMAEAERLSTLSEDTLRREHSTRSTSFPSGDRACAASTR